MFSEYKVEIRNLIRLAKYGNDVVLTLFKEVHDLMMGLQEIVT